MTDKWDPAKPLVARQPWKLFYTFYFLVRNAVSLPAWALLYTVPRLRPVSSWSYRTALFNKLTYLMLVLFSKTRSRTPQSLEPGKFKDQFVVLEPADDLKAYTGLLDNREIQPTSVGGIWLPNREHLERVRDKSDNWIILHLHGGAYVALTARDDTVQGGPKQFCQDLPADAALCLDYRLSSNPKSSHPAQLQDAITAYSYLIHDQGISPSRILISGDSAGGHLSIIFLRHLMAHPETELPLPRALLLHSPWLDLTPKGISVDSLPGAEKDYLPDIFLEWGATTFKPKDSSTDTELLCPASYPFKSPIPIWVQAGTVEKFYPTILKWVGDMRTAGSTIELYDGKELPHDVFLLMESLGLELQARKAVKSAKTFIEHYAS